MSLETGAQPFIHEIVGPLGGVAEVIRRESECLSALSTRSATVYGPFFDGKCLVLTLGCVVDDFVRSEEVMAAVRYQQKRLRDAFDITRSTRGRRVVIDAGDIVFGLIVTAVGAQRMSAEPNANSNF